MCSSNTADIKGKRGWSKQRDILKFFQICQRLNGQLAFSAGSKYFGIKAKQIENSRVFSVDLRLFNTMKFYFKTYKENIKNLLKVKKFYLWVPVKSILYPDGFSVICPVNIRHQEIHNFTVRD